jgi:hypothetical protein
MKALIACLISLIVLSGCRSADEGLDSSLLTSQTCKAPCWQNLTPGISTMTDVNEFLGKLSMQDWPNRMDRTEPAGCINKRLIEKDILFGQHGLIDLHIEDGYLTYIGSVPKMVFHLGQITDKLGPPQYIEPILAIGPEANTYFLTILYPDKGLSFEIDTSNYEQGKIDREMQVKFIEYSRPGDLISYYKYKNSCLMGAKTDSFSLDYIAKYVRTWKEYGRVDTIRSDNK